MKILGRPLWATLLALACMVPVGLYFALLLRIPAEMAMLVKFYPIYAIVTAWLAWFCYPYRRDIYWVLITLLLLAHAAFWLLPDAIELT